MGTTVFYSRVICAVGWALRGVKGIGVIRGGEEVAVDRMLGDLLLPSNENSSNRCTVSEKGWWKCPRVGAPCLHGNSNFSGLQ